MKKRYREVINLTILICLILFAFNYYILSEELEIKVNISQSIGIDLEGSTHLDFGTLPPGTFTSKEITISNGDNKIKKIKLKITGIEFAELNETKFILDPNSNKTIKLILNVPENAEGSYFGSFKIFNSFL